MAFVHDPEGGLAERLKPETVIWRPVAPGPWEVLLKDLIAEHARETQSRLAEQLLVEWPSALPQFCQVVPKEMLGRLPHPLAAEPRPIAAGAD